ncbi:UTRA domain-containing protein [Marinobacter daepoensis]|uniref:UTRA domain-containing protein n=1 Tax=Marinobacter daepoensis TaxID=262077 RepID=A0ABS3BDA6_9GAMM|nr:UTRA domain-containing protein [Marinobacter daepoensis]MBN7769800.1 UTRA domain-containing protein [Marinobacter daepoensis]MBY6078490.1 UTRA domain-containing protein [Marinobacter daepoensis]
MSPPTTYHSVAARLQSWIYSGELPAGSQLPSERRLCERLGVSRVNARDALHFLEGQGLIYRLNRIGWFVAPAPFIYDPTRAHSLLEEAKTHHRRLDTELIMANRASAPAAVCSRLKISAAATTFHVVRRRAVDGRWVLLETCFFREDRFPDLLEQNLNGSLTGITQNVYGYEQRQLNVAISSKPLAEHQAQQLRVREGSPALKLIRDVIVEQTCVAVEIEYWLHDAIEMRMCGQAQQQATDNSALAAAPQPLASS